MDGRVCGGVCIVLYEPTFESSTTDPGVSCFKSVRHTTFLALLGRYDTGIIPPASVICVYSTMESFLILMQTFS